MGAEETDERLLTLLAELESVRRDLQHVGSDYVHALRGWADYIKTRNENSIGLIDALLTRRGVGEMTERQIATVVARTENDINPGGPWGRLVEAADAYYLTLSILATRQAAVMGYLSYLENIESRNQDVPGVLSRTMEVHFPERLRMVPERLSEQQSRLRMDEAL